MSRLLDWLRGLRCSLGLHVPPRREWLAGYVCGHCYRIVLPRRRKRAPMKVLKEWRN